MTNTADVGALFPGAQWVIGPVEDAAGTPVYLYRLRGENPYAWVAPVIVKANDMSVGATLFNEAFDVRRAALFAEDAEVTGVENLAALPPPADVSASVTQYAAGKVSIQLSAPAPQGSALLVSENYYPGWRATVDGKPATVGRADYSLTGVQLPEGGRVIDLTFGSETYDRGKIVTLLALALVVVLIAGGIIMDRKALD